MSRKNEQTNPITVNAVISKTAERVTGDELESITHNRHTENAKSTSGMTASMHALKLRRILILLSLICAPGAVACFLLGRPNNTFAICIVWSITSGVAIIAQTAMMTAQILSILSVMADAKNKGEKSSPQTEHHSL